MRFKKIYLLISVILLLGILLPGVYSQVIQGFNMQDDEPNRGGLVGNGITDLLWENNILLVGTGFGMSTTLDEGVSWQNETPADYGGKGGISALARASDGTVWISTGYDTLVQEDQSLSAGGGLRYKSPASSE